MNRNSDPLTVTVPVGHMWHDQVRHLLMLGALLPGAWMIAGNHLGDGTWLGITDKSWFFAALGVPVIQQITVALLWRAQLCYGLLTRLFADAGFIVWGVIFFPLLILRPLLVMAVGLADTNSLAAHGLTLIVIGALFLVPALWTMHSVKKYFGFVRALGGDHFFERYRAMPIRCARVRSNTAPMRCTVLCLSVCGV